MVDVTPEQRAAWRAEARFTGARPSARDVLALLDALDEAEVKVADAWDEGFEAGEEDAMYEERGTGPYPAYPHKNPYRKQT
jgi:hypothetical protein